MKRSVEVGEIKESMALQKEREKIVSREGVSISC